MISPLDPMTRHFYLEMGYSEQQVTRAHEYAIRKKIDILDALNLPSQSPPPPPNPPPKQQPSIPPVSPPPAPSSGSFLTPMTQVRVGEYESLFSRSTKFNAICSRFEVR